MHGDVAIVVLILIFGCAAFFFGVIYIIARALGWIGRGLWTLAGGSPRAAARCCGPAPSGASAVCTRDGCQRIENRWRARYCSRCGAPLAARLCEESRRPI